MIHLNLHKCTNYFANSKPRLPLSTFIHSFKKGIGSVAQRLLMAHRDGVAPADQTGRKTYFYTIQMRELLHVCDTALNTRAKRSVDTGELQQ